ncbi:MAG TPA: hypothetical protein RMH99_05925 [Sandaracinaceae bacterium LLY-WYZ-13_1]|nr:hypothetical protein [Sandaracinaceae bacterium LLY-WYZ-13_1]
MGHRTTRAGRLLAVLALCAALAPLDAGRAQEQGGVELVEAGSGPREPLRHRFEAGQRQSLRLRLRSDMRIQVGDRTQEVEVPEMIMRLELGPSRVTDEGHMRYGFRLADLGVEGGDAQAREQISQALAGLVGTSGATEIDERGRTVDFEYELPDSLSPQVRQQAQSLRSALVGLLPRFPREPVGVGAVWRIRDTMRLPQASVQIETLYRLRRRRGDRVELQVRIESSDAAELPEGVQMDVNGHGRHRFVLGSLQTRARVETTAEVQMTGPRGSMRMRMHSENHVDPVD